MTEILKQYKLFLHKKQFCILLCIVVFVSLSPFLSITALGQSSSITSSGWKAFGTKVVTGFNCGPSLGLIMEVIIAQDEATGDRISFLPATIVSFDKATNVITRTIESQPDGIGELGRICYNPDTEGVGIVIDGTSLQYNDFYQFSVFSNPEEITRDTAYRSIVWISKENTFEDFKHNFPIGNKVKDITAYVFDLLRIPNFLPSSIFSKSPDEASHVQYFISMFDPVTSAVSTPLIWGENLVGGLGAKTSSQSSEFFQSLLEGYYVWGYYLTLNGSDTVATNGVSQQPTSSFSGFDWPFLYDKTAPTLSSHSATPNGDLVTIEASATDALSGLARIDTYVDNELSDACLFESSQSAHCNTIINPKVGFEEGTSHTYIVVATDSAGNTATSSSFEFSMPESSAENLVVTSITPTDNSFFNANGALTFKGSVQNLSGVEILEGGYAGLEIDLDADNAPSSKGFDDYYSIPDSTTSLGKLTLNEAKSFEYTLSNIPVGIHRYRFSVSTPTTTGHDDVEYSDWTTIRGIYGEIEASKTAVEANETVNLSWKTNTVVSMLCRVEGGGQTWLGLNEINKTTNPLNLDTTFVLSCNDIPLDSVTVTVNSKPEISIVPRIVPKGATSTIMWNTHNGDEGACTLQNGPTTIDYIPVTEGDPNTGYATIVVEGRSRYTLTCPTGDATFEVEIVPTAFEI